MKIDRPVLFYDDGCRFCRFMARGIEALDRRRIFGYLPFSDSLASSLLASVPPDEREHSIQLVFPDSEVVSAGDALAELTRVLPLGRLLAGAARDHRPVRSVFRFGYDLVANRRGPLSSFVPDVPGPLRRPATAGRPARPGRSEAA